MGNAHGSVLLAAWRKDHDEMTQAAFGSLTGISAAMISHYEKRRRTPQLDEAVRIAKVTLGRVPVESWVE